MTITTKYLRGGDFLLHIAPFIGIDANTVQKVIIEASYDDIVHVYVKLLGTDRLLEVKMDNASLEVLT